MLDTTNATLLLKTCPSRSSRQLAYPDVTVRVTTVLGAGELVYATDDGYVGVRLDGETRVDEYAAETVAVDRGVRQPIRVIHDNAAELAAARAHLDAVLDADDVDGFDSALAAVLTYERAA